MESLHSNGRQIALKQTSGLVSSSKSQQLPMWGPRLIPFHCKKHTNKWFTNLFPQRFLQTLFSSNICFYTVRGRLSHNLHGVYVRMILRGYVLLPPPLQHWSDRHMSPRSVLRVLGTAHRALHMPGKQTPCQLNLIPNSLLDFLKKKTLQVVKHITMLPLVLYTLV